MRVVPPSPRGRRRGDRTAAAIGSSRSSRAGSCATSIHTLSVVPLLAMMMLFPLVSAVAASFSSGSTGYDDALSCTQPCAGGDVNYELVASIRTMRLLNRTYKGRTYSRPGDASFMGPTLRVKPGQSLWIRLVNNMTDSDAAAAAGDDDGGGAPFGPRPPNATDYWNMLRNPGERIKYRFYKRGVVDPSLMRVDKGNMPKHFDTTNLHLHGLDIAVHMFHPVGTHDPWAPHIAVPVGGCYCYRFEIPAHHPTGMYWYHPHLHGSTALQIWSGMLGLLHVEGPLLEELTRQGVRNSQEFVIWDPALRAVEGAPTHDLEVDDFLLGQTTLSKIHPFLVNGALTPELTAVAGRPLHLRVLCGTIENENTFLVYPRGRETEPWGDAALPFWVIASDGVTYEQPLRRNIIVMAGGQREEILLLFEEPGEYVISQQGIQGMQFFDMMGHPHDQILATVRVTEAGDGGFDDSGPRMTPDDLSGLRFTPGYAKSEDIQAHDISRSETIVFSMGTDRDAAPFPQYYVNGKPFDPDRLDLFARPGEAVEYLLLNAQHNVHPFHIHVNRFQVQEMGSELSPAKYPVLEGVLDFHPGVWRDTVIVPPSGRARIWVQYKNYTGKTVFHCHFLAHEDTGMMATLFIGAPHVRLAQWLAEHTELLAGLGLGALLAAAALLGLAMHRSRSSAGWAPRYQPVAAVNEMNALKSKAMD